MDATIGQRVLYLEIQVSTLLRGHGVLTENIISIQKKQLELLDLIIEDRKHFKKFFEILSRHKDGIDGLVRILLSQGLSPEFIDSMLLPVIKNQPNNICEGDKNDGN